MKTPINSSSPVAQTPIKPMLIVLAISFGGYFASYLMTVLLTHMLGDVSYSAYISTVSMIATLALCLLLGVDQGLNKYMPEFFSKSDFSGAAAYLRYSRQRTWVQHIVVFILGLGCFFLVDHLISNHTIPDNDNSLILAFLWVVPLYGVMWYFGNLLQAGGYSNRAVFLLYGAQPVGLLILLGGCAALRIDINMMTAIYFYVAITILVAIIGIIICRQKQLLPNDDKKFRIIPEQWSKATIDLFLLLLVSTCSTNIFIILVQIFSKNIRAAGILGVLTIICNIFNPITNGVFALLSSKISTAIADQNGLRIRKLLIVSLIGTLFPSLIALFIIIFYGKVWLAHFGHSYEAAYIPLVLMGIIAFLNTMLTPFLWLLQFSKDLGSITKMAVTFLVLFVIVSIPLDYFYEVIGAIIGFAFIQIGYWIYLMCVVIKNWQQLYNAPATQ